MGGYELCQGLALTYLPVYNPDINLIATHAHLTFLTNILSIYLLNTSLTKI